MHEGGRLQSGNWGPAIRSNAHNLATTASPPFSPAKAGARIAQRGCSNLTHLKFHQQQAKKLLFPPKMAESDPEFDPAQGDSEGAVNTAAIHFQPFQTQPENFECGLLLFWIHSFLTDGCRHAWFCVSSWRCICKQFDKCDIFKHISVIDILSISSGIARSSVGCSRQFWRPRTSPNLDQM